eukprot:CAMPEP_0175057482 /NCGR_PEP_ID=MMETSP0052_2-20121109/11288_1 /TAXON_ID=51329 ORGANISM="Polytomella parva, Strain SAG 63-3" /NCGR_SAMPLE_ID=MMETSP0052_2 /ASSEMBLY_ACC=CAM_ASM_000194 /LENGTH=260 /DNA_ID=CAMNT_0016322699 /DNA_START=312 /DNA_END=1094 /DNA_ORIENTATION=+
MTIQTGPFLILSNSLLPFALSYTLSPRTQTFVVRLFRGLTLRIPGRDAGAALFTVVAINRLLPLSPLPLTTPPRASISVATVPLLVPIPLPASLSITPPIPAIAFPAPLPIPAPLLISIPFAVAPVESALPPVPGRAVPAKTLAAHIMTDGTKVHKVAQATAAAGILVVLTTRGFTEIRDRREFDEDRTAIVVPFLQTEKSTGSRFFISKFNVHIANQMISNVIANIKVFNLAKLIEFLKNILKERLEMFLSNALINFNR